MRARQVLQDRKSGRSAASSGANGASRINWGSHRVGGGLIRPNANAFELSTVWGAVRDSDGDNIVWGTLRDDDNIVWGTLSDVLDNIVWGTLEDVDNIVWGTCAATATTSCGARSRTATTSSGAPTAVVPTATTSCGARSQTRDNIVWGTADDGDNIVWGTATADDRRLVWATSRGAKSRCSSTIRIVAAHRDFNNTTFDSLVGRSP